MYFIYPTIYYLFYSFIFLIIFFFIYIKLKYHFWSIQPVFHFYDFYYWIKNVGIISTNLPNKNKYTNFNNVKTYVSLNENQWKNITTFIQLNYLKNKNNTFHPKINNIQKYFIGHNHPCYWSFYNIDDIIHNTKNNNIIKNNKIIGTISSRPLKCIIGNINFDLYYVDYLCVDKKYRKKNIAPQLIQTHEYNQSHYNKKISVSLFKREEELTGIIPLTCYDTFCYNVSDFVNDEDTDLDLDINIKILTCDKNNIYYFYHFMKEYSHKWNIHIFPTISNLYNLIDSKNIFIKMLIIDTEIIAAYIFKKTCTYLDKNKQVLSCIGSINGTQLNNNEFIDGFKISLSSLIDSNENENLHFLSIENISDNQILNNYTNCLLKSPTAYFFYNFAHSPFKSNKCLIIN
jgi:hypothetical protein